MSTWMVVEDEPGIYEVLLAMFEMWGVGGVAFVDGEEAVAWIEDVDKGRAKGERPELALVDIRLPGPIQGEMVGERLRKSPYLKDMAIVLITAYKLTPVEEKAIIAQAEADRLVYKPLPRFNELKTLLESVLLERQARKAAPMGLSALVVPTPTPPAPSVSGAGDGTATTPNASSTSSSTAGSNKLASNEKPVEKKVSAMDEVTKPLTPKEGNV